MKLSLLGTILSNLLLTTGLSFLLGGIQRYEQYFNVPIARTISMLLLLATTSLVIPTAAHMMTNTKPEGILAQSRGTSVVILISYVLWLIFSLKSHRALFGAPSQKAKKRRWWRISGASGGQVQVHEIVKFDYKEDENEEDIRECALSLAGALISLVISVVLVAFNTQFATDSIQALLLQHKISQTFLGLVILPLISNDTTAITVATKDKMDISIALTLERCMQTSLLIVPLTVLLGWILGVDDMTLEFDGFSIAALFASIVIVSYVVQEGKSNWYVIDRSLLLLLTDSTTYRLTGALLIKVFIIIALAAFYIH